MKSYAVYETSSGRIVTILRASVDQLSANIPDGCDVLEGEFDPNTQRIDVTTGLAVEYIPPAPEPAHHYEWNASGKWWELKADIAAKLTAVADAKARIDLLERQELRALRELALGSPTLARNERKSDADEQRQVLADQARERLSAIDMEISNLRGIIDANAVT
jgi:hypothetical protein